MLKPQYVIRKTQPVMQYLVSQGNWTDLPTSATRFDLLDDEPLLTEMTTNPARLSVGIVFNDHSVCWLPTAVGNWYTVDAGIPLTVVDALQFIKPDSSIKRLPEGKHSVMIDGKAYPVGASFYLKTTEDEARRAAALLGGEVSECLMPY